MFYPKKALIKKCPLIIDISTSSIDTQFQNLAPSNQRRPGATIPRRLRREIVLKHDYKMLENLAPKLIMLVNEAVLVRSRLPSNLVVVAHLRI